MAEEKPNALVRFGQGTVEFFRDYKSELKKIVRPTPESVSKNTGVVLAMILTISLFIFGLDIVFMNLLGLFVNIAK